jgi:hypothetical protein
MGLCVAILVSQTRIRADAVGLTPAVQRNCVVTVYTVLHVLEGRANANHGASYANQYKVQC